MRVIIAGGRDYLLQKRDYAILDATLRAGMITEVVCGGATGVDECGRQWAISNNVPHETFDAHWTKYGMAAGPIRNRAMADYADALIAFWDGRSRGTADMITKARGKGLKVAVYINGVKQ